MVGFIISFIIGIVCVILGIFNMQGNISSIHSYHRHRVSEEDRIPFGRKVGLGTIIVGVGVMLFSILSAVTFYTNIQAFTVVGVVIMFAGIALGLGMSLRAMIKYNNGIF